MDCSTLSSPVLHYLPEFAQTHFQNVCLLKIVSTEYSIFVKKGGLACILLPFGSILGWESPGVEKGNPLQYSCLENSMERGAWRTTVHGDTKSLTRLSTATVHTCSTAFLASPPDARSIPFCLVLISHLFGLFAAQRGEKSVRGLWLPSESQRDSPLRK